MLRFWQHLSHRFATSLICNFLAQQLCRLHACAFLLRACFIKCFIKKSNGGFVAAFSIMQCFWKYSFDGRRKKRTGTWPTPTPHFLFYALSKWRNFLMLALHSDIASLRTGTVVVTRFWNSQRNFFWHLGMPSVASPPFLLQRNAVAWWPPLSTNRLGACR